MSISASALHVQCKRQNMIHVKLPNTCEWRCCLFSAKESDAILRRACGRSSSAVVGGGEWQQSEAHHDGTSHFRLKVLHSNFGLYALRGKTGSRRRERKALGGLFFGGLFLKLRDRQRLRCSGWLVSCSLDSTAACYRGRKGGDGAKCSTADSTLILPRDSQRVGRRPWCTYRF